MKSLGLALLPLLAFGCGGGNNNNGTPDMAMATLGPAPALAMACGDQLADVYTLPSGLPAMDDSHRGDVFHCAISESLTADEVNAQAKASGYGGPTLPSGFWTYRISYRTERLTPATGSAPEGDTSGLLLIPEKPIPGAPLVVWAHGSAGIGPTCAPSKRNLATLPPSLIANDAEMQLYTLGGYGYTVLMPDYTGFGFGQVPGYFVAEDEAHAVLDATRAAANVLTAPPSKVVIVGHSQGGHAALAAHAFSGTYGIQPTMTLVGVAAYAPLWLSLAGFSAAMSPQAKQTTADNGGLILYSMSYLYSAGEMRDGPGGGLAMYQAAKRDAVKQVLIGPNCYDLPDLQALGAIPSDFVDPTFINNVSTSCAALPPAFGGDCTQGDAPKWKMRWQADRPAINPKGAPILVINGGLDTAVNPGFAQCGRGKLMTDVAGAGATTTVSFCYDAAADHHTTIRVDSDYVNQWIAARAGIGSDPAACAPFPSGTTCTVPPNDF